MQKKKKEINKRFVSHLIIVGSFILIMSGVIVIISKYYEQYRINKNEKIKVEQFFDNQKDLIVEETPTNNEDEEIEEIQEVIQEETNNQTTVNQDYIAVLQIPKINLERGLVDKNSRYNNVNSNIAILKESSMPDEENSTLILASHSGSSRVAFFNNLYKLGRDDLVHLYYKGIKYSYVVDSITEVKKYNSVSIQKTTHGKRLILITCKLREKKQIVVVCKLIEESNSF